MSTTVRTVLVTRNNRWMCRDKQRTISESIIQISIAAVSIPTVVVLVVMMVLISSITIVVAFTVAVMLSEDRSTQRKQKTNYDHRAE
jgi:transcriptional regulator of nitric oxide reductase